MSRTPGHNGADRNRSETTVGERDDYRRGNRSILRRCMGWGSEFPELSSSEVPKPKYYDHPSLHLPHRDWFYAGGTVETPEVIQRTKVVIFVHLVCVFIRICSSAILEPSSPMYYKAIPASFSQILVRALAAPLQYTLAQAILVSWSSRFFWVP